MVATTVVTTAIAGSTPTVVIANPANAHLSLPIGKNDSLWYIVFSVLLYQGIFIRYINVRSKR